MYETIEAHRTADGKLFTSEQQAQWHANDLLCAQVEVFIRKYFPTGHAPTTYKAVTALADNKTDAIRYLRAILEHLE